ncbi:hypothetical protein [Mycobacterium sp.]|uniref:hypothetical protein n=1 Tax=Mycobacterium sp. TaxID=1785 RepID=UPI003F973E51
MLALHSGERLAQPFTHCRGQRRTILALDDPVSVVAEEQVADVATGPAQRSIPSSTSRAKISL